MYIYMGLGSNQGARGEYMDAAEASIAKRIGNISRKSARYETSAWGKEDEPAFLNAVVEVETSVGAQELLQLAQQIESELERRREVRWGARTMDIDILFYGDEVIREPELTVPHPLLHLRRFVLVPLNEIAPHLNHPVLQKSVSELLMQLKDPLSVKRLTS